MGDLLGSPRVASLFLWYFSIVSGNSMFFLLITCYMPWTFRREHCPPCRNNTTRTPGAHREACGHGCGARSEERRVGKEWRFWGAMIQAIKKRIASELRS